MISRFWLWRAKRLEERAKLWRDNDSNWQPRVAELLYKKARRCYARANPR